MIAANNISVYTNQKRILDNVTACIPNKQITAILGPNGAGKSTLLKALTGYAKPENGTIIIDGEAIQRFSLEALSRVRAVLSQTNPVSFPFTALEIVKMGRNPYAYTGHGASDEDIACKALTCVDSLALKDRIFPTLSGGEQQRIQLARVIAQIWEMPNAHLFLDEPTSALDLKHQHLVMQLVKKLVHTYDVGVAVVMHDLNLALRYADQVLLMKEGRLFASGATQSVLNSENVQAVFEISIDSIFYHSVIS